MIAPLRYIPMYCATCDEFYNSPFTIAPGVKNVRFSGPLIINSCLKGHPAKLVEGTYDYPDDELKISIDTADPRVLRRMREIIKQFHKGEKSEEDAVEEIAEFLPSETAAAIKAIAKAHPGKSLLAVGLLLTNIAANAGSAFKSFSADPPPSQMTVINTIPSCPSGVDISKLSRPQLRRLKQMNRDREKRASNRPVDERAKANPEKKGGK